MILNHRTRSAFLAIIVVAAISAPAALSADHHQEEGKVVVDIRRAGPQVWSFREGGYLGIQMIDLTPELRTHFGVSDEAGVMLSQIADESPAAAAGLRVGDILTAVDGSPVRGTMEVVRAIGAKKGGQPVTLEVYRDGSYRNLEATLEERARSQFWLNTLSGEGPKRFEFSTEDGENVFVLPGPDAGELMIKRERVDELMDNLHERLASPEFSHRMLEVRSNTEELEARIKELEKRLEELAEQLETIDN